MKNIMTTRRPLELLHMDLFGPNAYKSLGGNSFGHDIFHGMPPSDLFTCLTSTAKSILIKYDIVNAKDMISFNKLVKVSDANVA